MAFLAFAGAPLAVAQETIDTGTVMTAVYSDGEIGGVADPGFVFDGINGLYAIGPLFSYGNGTVLGDEAYATPGANGWTGGAIGASSDFPYATLTNGVEASFSDGAGLDIVVNYYWGGSNTDFIVARYEYTNNTGGTLTGATPGLFIDWDLDGSTFGTNEAVWDAASGYIFDAVTPNYVGHVGLSGTTFSGWDCFFPYPPNADADVINAMNTPGPATCAPADIRGPVGFGAADLGNGETRVEVVAFLAAVDVDGFQMTAADAANAVAVAIEPGPDGLPGTHNLSAVYPNPFNPQANFTLEVAEQQSVRIAVYDALGREVATLFDGTLSAGLEHAFTINGAGLPSGIYMVRANGEQFTDVRRVTLMK